MLFKRFSRRHSMKLMLAVTGLALQPKMALAWDLIGQETSPLFGRFPGPSNLPRFLVGANYEGPTDRQWQMWQDDFWEPDLIRGGFEKAAEMGLHALRIFMQPPLDRELRRKRWNKIDAVVARARRQKLLLYVSLGDYAEQDLEQRARDYQVLAGHLAGNPAILCCDLRTELSFKELLFTRFPDGPNPLQTSALLALYGERVSLNDIAARRDADPTWIPAELVELLSSDELYLFANSLAIYEELLRASWAYVASTNDANTLDWLAQPEVASYWTPALELLDGVLMRWLRILGNAVRQGGRFKPITIDHNDMVMASLNCNRYLDFISLHAYPDVDSTFPAYLANQLAQFSARHARPALMGEFGWSSAVAHDALVASLEGDTLSELRQYGAVGAFKWMLNDVDGGEEGREGSYRLFNARGNRKPGAYVWRDAAE